MIAFRGIAHHLQTVDFPVYNFAGLPYVPGADIGARIKLICLALTFDIVGTGRMAGYGTLPERRTAFPSWTWVSWKGKADWQDMEYVFDLKQFTSAVTSVAFESAGLPGNVIAADPSPSHEFLDGIYAVHLEAPLVPVEQICLDNYYNTSDWFSVSRRVFLENLRRGIWSCILLGYVQDVNATLPLFVEWKDQDTAVRLGVAHALEVTCNAPARMGKDLRKVR